jgi:hypothetical protein
MQDDEKCEVPASQRKRVKNKSKIKVRQMPTVCRYQKFYSSNFLRSAGTMLRKQCFGSVFILYGSGSSFLG